MKLSCGDVDHAPETVGVHRSVSDLPRSVLIGVNRESTRYFLLNATLGDMHPSKENQVTRKAETTLSLDGSYGTKSNA